MAARSTEERIALIDAKISKKQEEIKTLEAQKQKLLHPVTMRTVMEKAKAAGLSAEEIAEKLGLPVEMDGTNAPSISLHIGDCH